MADEELRTRGMQQKVPVVLVVDDDEDCLEWFRLVLDNAGLRTVCCFDPADALDRLEAMAPDLIITDLMMGELDAGFQFIRRIRERPAFAALPIVLITAIACQRSFDFRPQNEADLAAMGVDAFFCKPVDAKALRSKVMDLITRTASRPSQGGGQHE